MAYGTPVAGTPLEGTDNATLTLTYPSGSVGDLIVGWGYAFSSGTTLNTPATCTSFALLGRRGFFGKYATSTSSGTIALTWAGGAGGAALGGLIRVPTGVTGWDIATLLVGAPATTNGTGADPATAALTVAVNNCLILWGAGQQANNVPVIAPPTGGVELLELGAAGGFAGIALAYQIQTTAANRVASSFDMTGTTSAGTYHSTVISLQLPVSPGLVVSATTPSIALTAQAAVVVRGSAAPVFDGAPSVTSQTASVYTIGYEASVSATNIYVGAYLKNATTPTPTQLKAGTGAHGTATEATTGAADSIVLTPTDSPVAPVYKLCAVLEGATGFSAVSVLADEFLDAPSARVYQEVTSIHALSPLFGTDAATEYPGVWLIDALTDPGGYTNITTDAGLLNYDSGGDSNRQISDDDFYGYALGAWLGAGQVVNKNKSPNDGQTAAFEDGLQYQVGVAGASVDLAAAIPDPEGDTVTVTALDELPDSATIVASVFNPGTPVTPGTYTIDLRAVDPYGGEYLETLTLRFVEGNVVVPEVEGLAQAAAVLDLEAVGIVVDVDFGYSDTVTAGYVISQDPAAGTEVEIGSVVTIVVASTLTVTTFRFELS